MSSPRVVAIPNGIFEENSYPLGHALMLIGEIGKEGPSEQFAPAGLIAFTGLREKA